MYIIKETDKFTAWLNGLRDSMTKLRLAKRLRKAELGNLGDIEYISDGVFEMREFFGPGWRMYYIIKGDIIIVMLGGGDKATQQNDIIQAIYFAKQLKDIEHD